jgi:cytidine deaminase
MEPRQHISTIWTGSAASLTEEERDLLRRAHDAAKGAYAPYSGFQVGAAARLSNGHVVPGCNQENAAFPSGLCAERAAVFAAGSLFPGVSIECLAVVTPSPHASLEEFSPCGGCRQVLWESQQRQDKPFRMLLQVGEGPVCRVDGVENYLPFAFGAKGLGKAAGMP